MSKTGTSPRRPPTTAEIERDVAQIAGDRAIGRPTRAAYDRAAQDAALATAATRKLEASADDHRRAARANLSAAAMARQIYDEEAARGHERLASVHDQAAARREEATPPSDAEIARATQRAIRQIDADPDVPDGSGRPPARQAGPRRVFVSEIWLRLSRDPRFRHTTETAFKHALARGHRDGLLRLARADRAEASDARRARASQVEDRGASYHLVIDDEGDEGDEGHDRARPRSPT